ncbi:hypothetical protein THOM_2691 [Trachipleistophora hominis]|uniref:Uncharacterized protein n=1 Tax=Trachipleistophora hominis TaxID=72359 RepID=L7JSD2_TRAHO|nr:hypothetical protein THOM_2691 [Trachipleistophora hominis]
MESAITTAVRCIQSTIAPGVSLKGDTFPEQMWFVYLHNLEIISKYESKVCDLETKNNRLMKSNKVLKDVVAHYMNNQKIDKGKKTFFGRLISFFRCYTLEENES